MRWDVQNQLCSNQAFTGAATVSTNAYKKQSAAQDLSIGRRMALLLIPKVAAGAGSTHTMDAIQADDAALTTNKEVIGTKSIAAAALTVGSFHELPIPQGVMTRQYLGFQNTSTGGTTTVTLDVYLVPQDEIPYFKTFPKVVDAEV
jgi:hypothetical protein